ncbi:MAG TPA: NapC/NirT family cytochrome c [Symbiobacteriaceae bacterium]
MRWRWIVLSVGVLLVVAALSYPIVATATPERDVAFCLTCHVMAPQGEAFEASYHRTHHQAATCSDCHTGSLVQKYQDGAHHVIANTLGHIPDPIVLKESSKEVVAGQCYKCHAQTSLHANTKHDKEQNCLECHSGHDPRSIQLNVAQ